MSRRGGVWRRRVAFTLVELLVVLFIIGVLLLVGVPNMMRGKADAEQAQVVAKARQLNTAKLSYIAATDRQTAAADWARWGDEERYQALRPYLGFPPADLATYTTPGYRLVLGDTPDVAVVVVRSADGARIETP